MSEQIGRRFTFLDRWIAPVVLLLWVLACSGGESTASSSPPPNPQSIQASKLVDDYRANEVRADQDYKGKWFEISGVVATIGKDILDTPYITLGDGFESVQALFSKQDEATLRSVNKGQSVRVTCQVDGKLMNVLARHCRLK